MPVPPKISFAKTMPKAVPITTIQSGIVGGSVSGISMPVTRKPSLISCLRIIATRGSRMPPVSIAATTTGT
jgi:hypothetical protein